MALNLYFQQGRVSESVGRTLQHCGPLHFSGQVFCAGFQVGTVRSASGSFFSPAADGAISGGLNHQGLNELMRGIYLDIVGTV